MSARFLIRLAFFCEGLALGLWFPRIAEFKAMAGLSVGVLATLFLCIPIASLMTMTTAPTIIARIGFRKAIIIGAIGKILTLILISFIPPLPVLFILFIAIGLTIGLWEIAANGAASRIERQTGPIMASCHGFWSLGLMFGGLIVALAVSMNMSFAAQMLWVLPVTGLVHFYAGYKMPSASAAQRQKVDGPSFVLPSVAILPICLLPLGGLLAEGAMLDWGAVYLDIEKHAGAMTIAWAITVFSGAMAASRLTGDMLRRRFSDKHILVVSYCAIMIGLGVWVLFPAGIASMVAVLLVGFGAGNVYPIALSLGGAFGSDDDTDANIAAVSMIAFFAFLAAPALFGVLGELVGLGVGFLVLIPLCLLTFPIIFGQLLQSLRK